MSVPQVVIVGRPNVGKSSLLNWLAGRRISIVIEGGEAAFQVGGKTIDFAGYLRAYVEGSDDPQAELADRETVLPDVKVGEELDCRAMDAKSHSTQPPSRYNEATQASVKKQGHDAGAKLSDKERREAEAAEEAGKRRAKELDPEEHRDFDHPTK